MVNAVSCSKTCSSVSPHLVQFKFKRSMTTHACLSKQNATPVTLAVCTHQYVVADKELDKKTSYRRLKTETLHC
jgi:hypothetical protein